MRTLFPSAVISRFRSQVRRHGFWAAIGETGRAAWKRAYLDETHVWYELQLATDRPRMPLPSGLALVRGSTSDLPLLEELPTLSTVQAKQRMEANNELWLVLNGGCPVFACWVLHGSVPIQVARGGRLAIPPGVVCLEDSVVSPSYRGRGMLGPPTWSKIADELERTATVEAVITKVEVDNKVMRWAVARSGFREVATMRSRRVGPWRRVALQARTGAVADGLAQQISPSRARA